MAIIARIIERVCRGENFSLLKKNPKNTATIGKTKYPKDDWVTWLTWIEKIKPNQFIEIRKVAKM